MQGIDFSLSTSQKAALWDISILKNEIADHEAAVEHYTEKLRNFTGRCGEDDALGDHRADALDAIDSCREGLDEILLDAAQTAREAHQRFLAVHDNHTYDAAVRAAAFREAVRSQVQA